MALIKKTLFDESIEKYNVFINDTAPLSEYFKITELPDTFTGGKNAFLIQGSEELVADSIIKIQIKDAKGDIIYNEPGEGIPEYYEGTSKVVSVYIYPDTSFGPCTITILGELKEYNSNGVKVPIPSNWENTYNVRWQKQINVNPFVANTTKIRFYRRPKIAIQETILPIFNRTVNRITVSGSVSGFSINPQSGSDFTNFNGDTIYELRATASVFSSSMEGETITVSGLNQTYSTIIKDVISSQKILATIPYYETSSATDAPLQTVKDFSNANFTLPYNSSVTLQNSSISSSFAKIKLTDLETFSGDVNRLKIFASRKADIGNYTLLEDIQLESNEILLTDVYSGSVSVRTGQFGNQTLINDFWKYKQYNTSTFYTAPLNNSVLASSVRLTDDTNQNITDYPQRVFYYSSSIDFIKNTEYQLDFSTTLLSSSFANGRIEVYGSGSAFLNTDANIPLGKLLGEYDAGVNGRVFGKQQINFKSDSTSTGTILFAVYQGDWYLSNLSLRASQETNFSPNELTLNVAVPTVVNNDAYDFKFEFYDINNNYVPITVNKEFTFVGAATTTVTKTLSVVPDGNFLTFSGSGQVIGANSINFQISTVGLSGSVTFASSAFDASGSYISPSLYAGSGYPGGLSNLTSTSATLTAESFTGSVASIKVTKIIYTASCEDVTDKVFIYRIDQGTAGANGINGTNGTDAKLLNAIATKNTFIFDPDDSNKPAILNDFIDIKVSTNVSGAFLVQSSSVTTPPLKFINSYSESANLVRIYRLFAGSTTETPLSWSYNTPSSVSHSANYTFFAGDFTSSVGITGALKGDKSKNLNVTANTNQFFYRMTDLSSFPSGQVINVLAKRNNLGSVSSSITITSGSGKPPLQIGSNNNTTGVQSYFISGSNYNFLSGSTTYTFTTPDLNGTTYNDTITISPVIVESQIAVSISNENTSFPALSTGTVPAGFRASSGSITVKVGTDTISYASTGTNRYTASFTASAGLTQTTGFNGIDYSISALSVDSGSLTINVTYFDGRNSGSSFQKIATYSKAKAATPSVLVTANPLNQSIVGNATGSQSGSLKDVIFSALEGNTSRFVSMSATYGGFTTNPTISTSTLTMTGSVIDRTKNEASASVIVYYTNSEGTAGSSSILISATKVNVGITGSNGTNGATGSNGPGVVFRGPWSSATTYYDTDDFPTRRDAVLYSGTYYATKTNPTTNLNKQPNTETTFWESLGTDSFFVAAEISIFRESYVQNTINVGTNGSGNANIAIVGGTTNPYISVGQSTQGYSNDGIFLGRSSSNSRVSFQSGSQYFKFDSGARNVIDIGGRLNATELLANSGSIGGFTIQGSKLRVGTPTAGLVLDGTSNKIVAGAESGSLSATLSLNGFHAGSSTFSTAPFRVGVNGDLYAQNAIISGSINAGQGVIGGWNIATTGLVKNNVKLYADNTDSYIQVTGDTGSAYSGNLVKLHAGALTGIVSGSSLNATTAGSDVNVTSNSPIYLTNSSNTATISTSNTGISVSLNGSTNYSIVGTIQFKIDVSYQSVSTNGTYASTLSNYSPLYAVTQYFQAATTTNPGTTNRSLGWIGDSADFADFISLYNAANSTSYTNISQMDGLGLDIITTKQSTDGAVSVVAVANYNGTQYGSNTSTFAPTTEVTSQYLAPVTFNINALGGGTANLQFALTKTNTLGTYYDVVRWKVGTAPDFEYNGQFFSGVTGIYASLRTQSRVAPSSVTYSAKGVSLTANALSKLVEITERGFQGLFNSATNGTGNFFKIEDIASPSTSNFNIKSAGYFAHYGELHVSGDIAGYSTALSSDERLKENIEEIGNEDIQKLYDLNAVEYNWKSDENKNLHYGFIAQDVEKIYPHLTKTKMMGEYLTINYTELIPIMVKEIQNLRKELDSIKKDINNAE